MSTVKERRIQKDYAKAFKKGEPPAFCPMRFDYSRINPSGNRCEQPIVETIHGHVGQVIGWRCNHNHIFGRQP